MRRHRLVIDPEKPEQCEKSTPPTHEIIREIHRQIICDTAEEREGDISFDGVALPDRHTMPIPDGAELEIERIGRLVIRPARKTEDGSLAKGEAKLAAALDAFGFKSVAQDA